GASAARRDCPVRRRLAVPAGRASDLAARLGGRQAGGWADGNAGGVVVGVRERHVRRIHSAVVPVGAGGRAGDDAVRNVAVVDKIIHACHGNRPRHVPIGGGEGHAGGRDRSLGRVAAAQRDGDIGRRLAVENDRERRGAACLGGDQPGGGAHRDSRRVVVGIADRNVGGIEAAVIAVRARGSG